MPMLKKWYNYHKLTKNMVRYHEVDANEVIIQPPKALYLSQIQLFETFKTHPEKIVIIIEER